MKTVIRSSAIGIAVVGLATAGYGYIAHAQGHANASPQGQGQGNDNKIAVLDECLPGDPAWAPTGGCMLKKGRGDVSFAEFAALLTSPLAAVQGVSFLMGHPAWRNEPSHLTVRPGRSIKVTNHGGRGHTFTEVTNFGGGFVPPLNFGLTPAPECLSTTTPPIPLAPGDTIELVAGAPGLHKFECCIHPWMRATVRVE